MNDALHHEVLACTMSCNSVNTYDMYIAVLTGHEKLLSQKAIR